MKTPRPPQSPKQVSLLSGLWSRILEIESENRLLPVEVGDNFTPKCLLQMKAYTARIPSEYGRDLSLG